MENIVKISVLMALCYTVYFFISYKYKLIKINTLMDALTSVKSFNLMNFKHLTGVFLFSIVFWAYRPDFDFLIINTGLNNAIISVLLFIIVIISGVVSKQSAIKDYGKREPLSIFKWENRFLYFSFRLPFLFFYELFFRGLVFHHSLIYVNLISAIIINLILYMLIHAFSSKKEIIGCIPFGIILCLFSYYTNSIWPAFIIHATLSFTYESTIFKIATVKTQKS